MEVNVLCSQPGQLHRFGCDDLVARFCQFTCRSGLDPEAQRLLIESQLLGRHRNRLLMRHAFDSQLQELRRVCLFGYFLHCFLFQSNVDLTSPLEDEIPGGSLLLATGDRIPEHPTP